MKIEIKPGRAHGSTIIPSSKSYAHRMVLAGALAGDQTVIRNIVYCEDILATLDCAEALGASYTTNDHTIVLSGTKGRFQDHAKLSCRDSGSTLRFFIPVALANGGTFLFTGSKRLFERGIGVYEDILTSTGIVFQNQADGISVVGRLGPGNYTLPGNLSSQYVSGLLLALPLLDGDSTVTVLSPVESRKYIDITIEILQHFGIIIHEDRPNFFKVCGNQTYHAVDCVVEGDWSSAAFLIALNYFGGNVDLIGLNQESIQSDRVFPELLKKLEKPSSIIDISACPDLGPVLFAAAAYKNGAVITGTRRLRIKESDRAAAMAEELDKFGAHVSVFDNHVIVHGGNLKKPEKELFGHKDHRIVMALAVLSSVTGGTINGCDAVRKSYPDFFSTLEKLGLEVIYDT